MSLSDGPDRTGYVVKVYPRFSETFVVTEILAREEAGEQLDIFALRPTTDARFHPEIARVQAPVHHLAKPTKLADSWLAMAQARQVLPDFDARFAALLPVLTRVEPTEAVQGLALALEAHRAGTTHLHVHFASAQARVARIASGLTGIPYSVTTHAKDLFHESVDHDLLADVLGHAAAVVAISDYNRRFLSDTLPEVAGHTHLVRNGLDLDRFPYADPQPVGDVLKVVGVGRLVEKKGFGVLVDAVARATSAGLRVQVRIAGDGDLTQALQHRVDSAGLTGTVRLVGPRSQQEVRDLLEWADVLAAPCVVGADGNADGLPTVLLEAMAMGVPCISTAVTGIPEAVHPETDDGPATGILLAPGDTGALAASLHAVADPAYPRVEVARAARAQVERDYDTRTQSRLLAALQHQPSPVGR
jgi:glycosyltransferase involved in cell wall biosynthesis